MTNADWRSTFLGVRERIHFYWSLRGPDDTALGNWKLGKLPSAIVLVYGHFFCCLGIYLTYPQSVRLALKGI